MRNLIWLTVLLGILASCKPPDFSGEPPVASYKMTPETGKTTDTFRFDASLSRAGSLSNKAYYRWDWNRDGIWDDEYSKAALTGYRFLKKGSYRPVLEVINSDGLTDTISFPLVVSQGYSPPKPSFTIVPTAGNIKTRFQLDATGSIDDEDSISQLRFMWDFDGNGSWDTPQSSKTTTSYVYPDTGRYEVVIQAVDPQNMRKNATRTVWVTDLNPRLVADFTWTPDYGTTTTEFTLNGSASHSLDEPRAILRYSWKLPSTNYEWTEWSSNPEKVMKLQREDTYKLELRVMDTGSLVNYCKKSIRIYHQNLPPKPKFIIGCRQGNIRTQFFFDSWATLDQESLPSSLEVRWDFNGDQKWDKDFSLERKVFHNFPQAGTYKIIMEARDPDGLSDTISHTVEVTPWTNETGLIYDQRDQQYYGSVKIGDQWWMSQNLNFAPYDPTKDYVEKWCYDSVNPISWCDIVGGLYSCYHATREDFYGEVRGICPWGWHIPSRKEWEKLVSYIGGWDQASKLLPGESTGFNALYGGCGELAMDKDGILQRSYKWINYAAYFWSFNKMSNPYAPNAWSLALIKGEAKFYPGFSGLNNYYSVRCLKNEE